uniref:LAGLIDADG endonuclease n=1 Tax=Powellomyces hirtus TaxID=109895 RepID=A0A4P8NX07_9FUNG|nr:LAGLIDADG endonuclease [Powellomyces hirtus]
MGIIRLRFSSKNTNSLQRLNVRTFKGRAGQSYNEFCEWFVGFVDGDGTFTIDRLNNGTKWNLVLKVDQNARNSQVLNYIKTSLGVGNISKPASGNWCFRIRSRAVLKSIIFPIFDAYPLITVKYFDYMLVKEAYDVLESGISREEINCKMEQIYSRLVKGPQKGLKSVVWSNVVNENALTRKDIGFISMAWLIGFWEADGSFYITRKDKANRLAHAVGLSQKEDRIVLEAIRLIFRADAKVRDRRPTKECFIWESTSKAIHGRVIEIFDGKLVGRASLRFSIWKKSLNYTDSKLIKARDLLRKLSPRNID